MSANEAAMKVVVAKLANDSRATQLFTRSIRRHVPYRHGYL